MSMAGIELKDLIDTNLHHPSGLTIDYNMNDRLFWSDSHQDVIESCASDGNDRVTLIPPGTGQSDSLQCSPTR